MVNKEVLVEKILSTPSQLSEDQKRGYYLSPGTIALLRVLEKHVIASA